MAQTRETDTVLARDEYIEQAYFFRELGEKLTQNTPTQEVLASLREEILASTKLPLAVDYLLSELKHGGAFAPAMRRLPHYFTAFQGFVVAEAEKEQGRFDLRVALDILRGDAQYRAEQASPQGLFLYQFESICRNRLGYDGGLEAMAADPLFDPTWRRWIRGLRRQVGTVDVADLIYVCSQHYWTRQATRQPGSTPADHPVLFGEKEGRIALANRRKDPLLLFAALQRHLGYPAVPRPKPVEDSPNRVPVLARRIERIESRLKLLEEEMRGGIDLSRYLAPPG